MRGSNWLAAAVFLAASLVIAVSNRDDRASGNGSLIVGYDRDVVSPGLAVLGYSLISQLTGPDSSARTDVRWNIVGTDLGISFEHGGRIYMVFGDTWGRGGGEGHDWRSNIMVVVEPDPQHGYVITDVISDRRGKAKELVYSIKNGRPHHPGSGGRVANIMPTPYAEIEYTVVPTAAIAVGDRMYIHYMSVRDWERHWWGYARPVVNGAGFAYSDDQGQTWVKDQTAYWPGDTEFTQAAMVQDDGYVYVFGTEAGRFGALRLLRVPGEHLLDPERYEYWTGEGWGDTVAQAAEVVPASVGELSVRWSPHHQRWLMMYMNESRRAIVLRTAPRPEGPWDKERVVVTHNEYPDLYAPFMLPIDGPDVYFTMSIFAPVYNVFVMRMTVGEPHVHPP